MDDIILDEIEDKQPEGIPSGVKHYISRYILILFLFLSMFEIYVIIFTSSIPVNDKILIIFLKIVIPVLLIIYNLRHAFMEQKKRPSIPKFPKAIIAITIALLALRLLGFLGMLIQAVIFSGLDLRSSFSIIIIIAITVILKQELKYYNWWTEKGE